MIINGKEVSVLELVNKIDFGSYKLRDNGKGILLNDYQIEVLKRNGFDYFKYGSLSELIFDIDNYLNDGNYDEELESVIENLAEIHYYKETNK
jgi:hypothetical protein